MVSNAYQGQLKMNKRKMLSILKSFVGAATYVLLFGTRYIVIAFFVFCKVVVITLQPALKIASI